MKQFYFYFLLILCLKLTSQTGLHFQWHKNAIYNIPYVLNKDTFYNITSVGYNASGDREMSLLNPTTGGWKYLYTPLSATVGFSIVMKDKNNGIITGSSSYITSDNWATSTQFTNTAYPIGATSFGYYGHSLNSPYQLMFSSNGTNWTSVGTATVPSAKFKESPNKVFALGNNELHYSTNGGASYSTITYTSPIGTGGLVLHTPTDDTLYVVETNNMKKSVDGGSTWTSVTLPSSGMIAGSACKNGHELMLYYSNGTSNSLMYSPNAGSTWSLVAAISVIGNGSNLMATSDCFMIYPDKKSVDGFIWTDLYKKKPSNAMEINFTGNVGIAGFDGGYVGISQDKGVTFKFSASPVSNEDIMAAKVLDNGKMVIGDRLGQVFVSSDMGTTWVPKHSNATNLNAYKISGSSNSNTIICARAGQPLRSLNGGNTFSIVSVGGGSHFQTIAPGNGTMIDVGGSYLAPTYTIAAWDFNRVENNGSKTLLSSISPSNIGFQSIVDIHMKDDNVGYFLSKASNTLETYVYKTTDGWQNVSLAATLPVAGYAIYATRIQTFGDTVIISGAAGGSSNNTDYYHISTDAGATWTKVTNNFNAPNNSLGNKVYKMWFHNSKEYFALIADNFSGITVASQGAYLSLSGSGIVNPPQGMNEFVASRSHNLIKVYPNPSVNEFNLKSENEFYKVSLYSAEGKLVKDLSFDNNKDALIQTNDLRNGIYFLKVYFKNNVTESGRIMIMNN